MNRSHCMDHMVAFQYKKNRGVTVMFPTYFRALDPTASMATGGTGQIVIAAEGDAVQLPFGFDPASSDYARAGPDLILTGEDGSEVIITDFYMNDR